LCLDPLEERTLLSAVVHPLFDLAAVATSPFPTDRFTVADATQNTGQRVNLPLPNQATNPSDYQDTLVLNTLDGFNLQPRLSIPFDGPINVNSVSGRNSSPSVFLVSLGDTLPGGDAGGEVVGINQIVWDPPTNTLHVESDQLLDQHTRYALIVTDGVLDAAGQPIQASADFTRFEHDQYLVGQARDPALSAYRNDLLDAILAARRVGVAPSDIAAASVFTTQSATAVLEKIRDQIHAATPAPADFLLGPGGTRTVYPAGSVLGITANRETVVGGQLTPVNIFSALPPSDIFPGTVGRVAFGRYSSPDYQVHPDQYIPPVATRTGTPVVQGMNEIYFNLYLPSGPMPADGWPVAIFGHGINSGKDTPLPLNVASSMAAHGVATVIINAVGHGFGPRSTLTVTTADASVTFPAAGRGVDQTGDNRIGSSEGISAGGPLGQGTGPRGAVFFSDGYRQTAADLMQLTRVIDVGMDVDGDGSRDLDASRIYYLGNSLGGGYGTVFTAVEPSVRAAVLTVPVDPIPVGNLGLANRALLGTILGSRQPSLLNAPGMGIKFLDGLEVPTPYFDENMPLRDQTLLTVQLADGTTRRFRSPVSNTVAGAMPIQDLIEKYEWVGQAGSPAAYAPHLRKDPLPGVPAKSVIIQIAKGDETAPNPTTTAIVRAGELTDRTVCYRHDLARVAIPSLPRNPHGFMVSPSITAFKAISLGAQAQIATFFASDGTEIIQPPGVPVAYFEVPIQGPLPEGLNYPGSASAAAPAQASESQVSSPIPTGAADDGLMVGPLTAPVDTTSAPAGVPATPAARLVDRALEALPPLARFEYALDIDDLAAGLPRPARRRR
jgi:hypothetical protein